MAGGLVRSSQRRNALCEFYIQHGEGKQWYLQTKNYSTELLNTPLTEAKKEAVGFNTRLECLDDDFKWTFIPAGGGTTPEDQSSNDEVSKVPDGSICDEQIVARRKIKHFGQVLPVEDVEQVVNQADPITRLPCARRYFSRGLINKRCCFGN
jgi:hypothetical protein